MIWRGRYACPFGLKQTGVIPLLRSAANSVYATFFRVKDSDWTPGMVAAHCMAAKRRKEFVYPAASLRDLTQSDEVTFAIPDPYDKADRPDEIDVAADLNNGITPVCFRPNGQAYLPRQITSYSVLSGATKDYRARPGHIPSVVFEFWEELARRFDAQRQDAVAADPIPPAKPLAGVMYPSAMRSMVNRLVDDMAGPFSNGKPLLDPSPEAIRRMKDSLVVELNAAGFGVQCLVEPVRHDYFDDFLINQGGVAY